MNYKMIEKNVQAKDISSFFNFLFWQASVTEVDANILRVTDVRTDGRTQ